MKRLMQLIVWLTFSGLKKNEIKVKGRLKVCKKTITEEVVSTKWDLITCFKAFLLKFMRHVCNIKHQYSGILRKIFLKMLKSYYTWISWKTTTANTTLKSYLYILVVPENRCPSIHPFSTTKLRVCLKLFLYVHFQTIPATIMRPFAIILSRCFLKSKS